MRTSGTGRCRLGKGDTGGSFGVPAERDGYVIRLTSSGTLDTAFGAGGMSQLTTPGDGGMEVIVDLALDANGDIVLVGGTGVANSGGQDWIVARYCGN